MKKLFSITILVLMISIPMQAFAGSKEEIDIRVDAALERFQEEVQGGKEFLKKAEGILVLPKVLKAGFGIGGEYGEGAMQIDGKTVDYYSIASASIGFQIGAQSKSIVMVFLEEKALEAFQKSEGWKAGVDGSVAIAEWGVGEDINTIDTKDPIIGFVFSNKGLMYNLTIEGSKFSKLNKYSEVKSSDK